MLQVEQEQLWERLPELMAPRRGADDGSSVGINSSGKYSLRDNALRRMLWLEDEAPPARVTALQHAVRRVGAPLPNAGFAAGGIAEIGRAHV